MNGRGNRVSEVTSIVIGTNVCVQCQSEFEFTESEKTFYEELKYEYPKRCKSCRKANKEKKKNQVNKVD